MGRLTNDEVYAHICPPGKKQHILWDSQGTGFGTPVPGFGHRTTDRDAQSYVLQYRFADPAARRRSDEWRYTIGPAKSAPRAPGWGLDEARKEADGWWKKIDRGETHPLAQRRGSREAARAAREAETLAEAYDDYYKHEAIGRRQNATADAVKASVFHHCVKWLDHPAASITSAEIGKLLRQVRDGDAENAPRPYMANRLHAYLSTFFGWCAQSDVKKRDDNPMLGMPVPWNGEEVRDKVFADKELKQVWKAGDEIGGVAGAYVKTLLLVGKRKTAWALARWDQIEAVDGYWLWVPPVDKRKRKRVKRQHVTLLPPLAVRVLAPLKPKAGDADASPFVFPGRKRGSCLYPGSDLQDDIIKKSGVTDFFYHAIKHTIETWLEENGVLGEIRDLMLDHASKRGSGKGYAHARIRDELAKALAKSPGERGQLAKNLIDAVNLWADHIEGLVAPQGVKVLR